MPHILISASQKSSGKTAVAVGLCAALSQRGLTVQPFKKGPDYIDPLWLSRAARRPCHNLDFHTMTQAEVTTAFAQTGGNADISIIEGNKGLHDGVELDGSNSNAALARLLSAPVVLVIDTRGITRGIAPLLLGHQSFDASVQIAGVILNQVGGPRHESKLRAAVQHYTDIPVLGAIGRHEVMRIAERHLGLIPANEHAQTDSAISGMRDMATAQIDLAGLTDIAASAPAFSANVSPVPKRDPDVRIGVARDAAFGFYYPDDLDAMQRAGAELITVDTLRDVRLPDVDGLFIGGGFPEMHMQALEKNRTMRESVHSAITGGLPVYAECGGLMYLARRVLWGDRRCSMVGALETDVVMQERPQGRGYVLLKETGKGLWPAMNSWRNSTALKAHEFHHSHLSNMSAPFTYAYRVIRGHGIDGKHDGIVHRNVLASYSHLRDVSEHRWTERFVQFVRDCKH